MHVSAGDMRMYAKLEGRHQIANMLETLSVDLGNLPVILVALEIHARTLSDLHTEMLERTGNDTRQVNYEWHTCSAIQDTLRDLYSKMENFKRELRKPMQDAGAIKLFLNKKVESREVFQGTIFDLFLSHRARIELVSVFMEGLVTGHASNTLHYLQVTLNRVISTLDKMLQSRGR